MSVFIGQFCSLAPLTPGAYGVAWSMDSHSAVSQRLVKRSLEPELRWHGPAFSGLPVMTPVFFREVHNESFHASPTVATLGSSMAPHG